MTTKEKVKDIFIISNGVFWFSYLIKSFFIFQFNNPYKWILDLQHNKELRICTIIFSLVTVLFFLIYTNIMDAWNEKSNHVKRILIIFILGFICAFFTTNFNL